MEIFFGSECVKIPVQEAENSTSGWEFSENNPRLVPGFICQRSGMFPERFPRNQYLWVRRKYVQFGRSSQDAGLRPVEFLGECF